MPQLPDNPFASEETLTKILISNANRVAKLISLNAPHSVVCQDAALLFKRMLVKYGPEMGTKLGQILTGPVRNWHGLCAECGQDLENKAESFCIKCRLQEEMKQVEWEDQHPECEGD